LPSGSGAPATPCFHSAGSSAEQLAELAVTIGGPAQAASRSAETQSGALHGWLQMLRITSASVAGGEREQADDEEPGHCRRVEDRQPHEVEDRAGDGGHKADGGDRFVQLHLARNFVHGFAPLHFGSLA
jgi:hypothetical protein